MKNLRTIALCVSISFYSLCTSAQTGFNPPVNEPNYNKPELFRSLPENIRLDIGSVSGLFNNVVGSTVSSELSQVTSFQFKGQVVSSVSKYDNKIVSVVIRSTNYPGALLTFSRITDANGTISYTGRIVSMQHGDLFELKNINDQFVLVKKKFHDLVNE
ncbi:MAG TPA: hypothetical protein VGO58_17055 [Chitinophagaceae bacterium]|jgi:hypothetical protein|nr:hypothetical protein [Chitinophagaceae bacterium]